MIFRIFFIFLILCFQQSTFAAFPSAPSSREGNILNKWQRDSIQPFILLQEKITNPEEAMSNSVKVVTVITEYKDSVSLVNIATAFSVLGRISSENPTIRKDLKESGKFTNLISVLENRIDKFETREFVNALVGLVKIGYYNEDLFDRLAEKCLELSITDPQHLANTAWAFAKVDHYSKRLFDALKEESIRQISGFNPQNLANTAWAFASIDHYSESLFRALKKESIRQLDDFNSQDLANTAWAFAIFNKKDTVKKIIDHVIKNQDVSRLPLKTKVQLIQAASLFKNEYRELIEQVGSLVETHPSGLQKEIFALLVQIEKGISFSEEEEVIANCIVDIAIKAHKIAIEVDGPSHYARNSSEKPHLLGRNRLKENILEAQGWKLIRIPYFVWDSKTTESDHKEYLSSLLKKNGFTFPEKRKRSDSK